jgi:signal transduction histidine kinase
VDSGGMAVTLKEVDLNVIAREAVADYQAQAETAGHTIEAETDDRAVVACTDALRVRQVLDNLISNAIKYTPAPGRIFVRVTAVAKPAPFDGPACAIEVADNGPGIPPDRRESVFDEFMRLDDHGATKGHGLGLAIARGVARLLGGELTVADTTPGATFVLLLPRADGAIHAVGSRPR